MHILVVEDNALLAHNLADGFEQHGHSADFAISGTHGLALALDGDHDVIVLDLGLPGMDGVEVCRQLRERAVRRIPVLMLTARDTLADKLCGFDSGADDYLVKPFAMEELMARCAVLARRHTLHQAPCITVGSLTVDRATRSATRAGNRLDLTPAGFQILLALAEAHPRALTRTELTRVLWADAPPDSDALRTHLYQLRQRLDKPFERIMLVTLHGVGFRLDGDA